MSETAFNSLDIDSAAEVVRWSRRRGHGGQRGTLKAVEHEDAEAAQRLLVKTPTPGGLGSIVIDAGKYKSRRAECEIMRTIVENGVRKVIATGRRVVVYNIFSYSFPAGTIVLAIKEKWGNYIATPFTCPGSGSY